MPYIPVQYIEDFMETYERTGVQWTSDELAEAEACAYEELERYFESAESLVERQHQRLTQLDRTKQKLIDAYVADAIPVTDLKVRQMEVAREIADAHRLILNTRRIEKK